MSETEEEISFVVGSGNVFADLGVANPEEALLKAELAYNISEILKERNLTPAQAAELLEIDQPKVSALVRGHLTAFSIESLITFVKVLDHDVQIVIRPKPETRERGLVSVIEHRD